MAKKGSSGKKGGKKSQQKLSYSDLSEDEIEKNYKQREKILFDEDSNVDSDADAGFDEETLMDLPSESEEDEGEYSEDDVVYAGEDEGEEKEDKWGKSKKAFYSADRDALDEEAEEAKKLLKKRLASMKAEDFTGCKKISASASKKYAGPVTLDLSSEDEDEDEEEEEELESFELTQEQVASLDEEERERLLCEHSPEFASLLKDFKERLVYLEGSLQPLMDKIKELPTSDGLSFLQVKYQLLTAYCTNVAFYMRLKLSGKPVEGHPVLPKLVKFRLLLEKLRPMEQKLRYQVDRLLKAANGQIAQEEEEASRWKVNVDAFVANEDESEAEETDGAYKAPKLQAMHYPEDDVDKQAKKEAYLRKVNASSRLIEDIRAEFDDAPEEEALDLVHGREVHGKDSFAERERYEEENYMRFTLDKKARKKLEARNKVVDELEDLNDFINEFGGAKAKGNKRSHRDAQQKPQAEVEAKKSRKQALSDESDIEDDFYKSAKKAKHAKKATSQAKPNIPIKFRTAVDMGDANEARPANWKILKNRGLTPNRKESNNPRLRQRKKFERAEKRLGSFRAVNKTSGGKYGGEGSGIRSDLVRSTKF